MDVVVVYPPRYISRMETEFGNSLTIWKEARWNELEHLAGDALPSRLSTRQSF